MVNVHIYIYILCFLFGSVRVQIVEPSSESTVVRVGSTLGLRCTGSSRARLVWFHNDDPDQLLNDDAVTIQTALDHRRPDTMTSLLRLTRVTARHAGTYSCRNQRDPSDRDDVIVSVENGRSGDLEGTRSAKG